MTFFKEYNDFFNKRTNMNSKTAKNHCFTVEYKLTQVHTPFPSINDKFLRTL